MWIDVDLLTSHSARCGSSIMTCAPSAAAKRPNRPWLPPTSITNGGDRAAAAAAALLPAVAAAVAVA